MALCTSLSWLPFPSIILLLPILFLTTHIIFKRSRPTLHLPPGPSQLPIIGNLHQVGALSYNSLWSLSRKHGPLMHLKLGCLPTLVVSSAKHASEVMKFQDLNFCSRPPFLTQKRLSYNFSDISFAPYGENWREMRKVSIVELFNTRRIQSFRSIREEEVARMIMSISKSSHRTINLGDMLMTLTNNIICRAAFGKRYTREGKEKGDYNRIVEEAEALFAAFFFTDFIPWLGWIDKINGQHARLEKNFYALDDFYEKVIKEHMNAKREKLEQEDFVDVLIRVQKDHKLTRDHIKAILMDILIAGTGTGSATLTWAMAELVRNPIVMKRAQDEVRRAIGGKNRLEESEIPQLQYLKSVVKETLRLHPPVPLLLPRQTIECCKIDGYDILPKTLVLINAQAIGRDPDRWQHPNEFTPERFIDSEIDYKGQHFDFIPFGAGRRICPGMFFGTTAVELALANLLYFFNWELPSGTNNEDMDLSEAPGLVVHKKYGLILVVTNYNSSN